MPRPALRVARGLRTKIMVRFAVVALVLSAALGTITYQTVRRVLLEDRQAGAVDQVTRDARLLSALGTGAANPSEVLVSLRPPTRSTPLLLRNGEWFAASLQVRPEDLPEPLVSLVADGDAARQRVWLRDRPVLVVGVPLGAGLGSYFEVISLVDVAGTLNTLLRVLVLAGAITTVAGVVLAGWIAGRVLRPLRDMTRVAHKIAAGELETRLDETLDQDLEVLTASFNRMADSLEARIAKEARFASDVAHELRTPLTTVVTSLAVLEGRQSELSEESREALDLLTRDVRRLERTASDLIEVAKLDAGVEDAELEVLPAASVVSGLLNRLRRTDIPVDIDHGAAQAMIRVNERRLERVLTNLIDNADMHGGGVVRVAVEGGEGTVRISVEDAGPGVPPEERERIFERFARGAASQGSKGGSGLGLALAAQNAHLQGGRVWVEPAAGGGARFVVELEADPS